MFKIMDKNISCLSGGLHGDSKSFVEYLSKTYVLAIDTKTKDKNKCPDTSYRYSWLIYMHIFVCVCGRPYEALAQVSQTHLDKQ